MKQHNWVGGFLSAGVLGAALLWSGHARASIAACGDIDVQAQATCVVQTEGGCSTQCNLADFSLACSAELYSSCQTDCNITPPNCNCSVDCSGECSADAGSFDCEGSCKGGCEADCMTRCDSTDSECQASCKSTCAGECSGSCSGSASASCSGQCAASCDGECKAIANMDCQTTCQSQGYASCETRLKGSCKTECTKPEGALFCDGQYVDRGGHAQECIDALNAYLKRHVTASGSASSSCSGNTCMAMAEGKATAKCSMAKGPAGAMTGAWASALSLLLVAAARRSKR
ncbi:MAG TPA: hypothetical protein VL137_04915 [Polyangiaceae bacterium]|nr:hypothetical protein [Polyangiaceae bacterium]